MKLLGIIILLMFICTNVQSSGDMVRIAQSQIGRGEIGGDNRGKDVKEFTRGKEVPWCAGFVSYVAHKAGKSDRYFLSAKSFWRVYRDKRVRIPKAGDIICFTRGPVDGPLGHVGIVETVNGNIITTIEGNVGEYPAKVKRLTYKLGEIKNLLGFVRL